jgi:hypothetical protein
VRAARDIPVPVPLTRRQAFGSLVLGVGASAALAGCISRSNEVAPPQGNPELYDVKRSGAVCDGVTDDTEAWAHAVATVSARGGGLIWWRGISMVTQIQLANKVGLCGAGPDVSAIKQRGGRPEGQHLILVDQPDATYIILRDFLIDGNRSSQTGSAAAIYLDNTKGSVGGVLARHLIHNVHVRNVAGTGLYWGYGMRTSLVDGFTTYACDGYGVHGAGCSDNTFQNMDVGRSGEHGVYLRGCANSKFSNIKSWYSGQLKAGSAGVFQSGGNTNVYSNISTQENTGTGMVMHGESTAITGVIVQGFVSDSDNTQGSSSNWALELNNVAHSMFDLAVVSEAPQHATPYAGVIFTASSRNKVTATIDPTAVTWELAGANIGDNDVDLCRGATTSIPSENTVSVNVYQHREQRITLTGDRTVNNPAIPVGQPPVGLSYRFVFIQDDSGGHVLTWSSTYRIPSTVSLDSAANTCTVIEFECAYNGHWIMTKFSTGIPE